MTKALQGKGGKKGSMAKLAKRQTGPRSAVVARKLRSSPNVTTVFVGKKRAKVNRRPGPGTVILKQVYSAGEPPKTLFTVDVGSKTFGTDLQYVFEKNVARARRENKKKFGLADPLVAKD